MVLYANLTRIFFPFEVIAFKYFLFTRCLIVAITDFDVLRIHPHSPVTLITGMVPICFLLKYKIELIPGFGDINFVMLA